MTGSGAHRLQTGIAWLDRLTHGGIPARRLTVLLGLGANLFLPWGIATSSAPLAALGAVVAFAVKVAVLGAGLAALEVFVAKWRLFRVPELLAGSFLFGLLAVSSSFFLA